MGIQQDFFQYAGKGLRPDFYLALLALCVTVHLDVGRWFGAW